VRTEDRDREFRLRPPGRRPKPTDEPRKFSAAFKRMMHFVRMSSRRARKRKSATVRNRFQQRCAIRVTYSPNRSAGQWAAHGRYLVRESATHAKDSDNPVGFGPRGPVTNIPATLRRWQTAGDPRLFKLIISPEFGDRCDLESLTRNLLSRMESDLGTRLEWVATAHYNTEHPHVHVALRGITDLNQPLRLDRSYIQHGIRAHAENLTTRQIGYRTVLDAEEAQRREIHKRCIRRWIASSTEVIPPLNPIQTNPTDSPSILRSYRQTSGNIISKRGCYFWRSWIWPNPAGPTDGSSAPTFKQYWKRCKALQTANAHSPATAPCFPICGFRSV